MQKNTNNKSENNIYRTKCWNIYLSIEKLTCGNLFNKPLSANNRQLRSVFTSIFNVVDGKPPLEFMQAKKREGSNIKKKTTD